MPRRKFVPPRRKTVKKPRFRWQVLVVPAAVALVLVIASFGFAATQEEHDTFCASCHTQPETTYFQREQQSTQADLAAFHTTKGVNCIDCHSGSGVFGRVGAIMEGSHNALAFYTRTATQPSVMRQVMPDANCVKCHADVYTQTGFDHHYHSFLTRWQAADPNAAGCVNCHAAHPTDGSAQIAYLSQVKTEAVCQQCHGVLREGG